MTSCTCQTCATMQSHKEHIAALPEQHQAYFYELVEHLYNVQADLDWYKAVLNGSWPSSKEILTAALQKI